MNQLGIELEKQYAFDPEIGAKLEKPYELSKSLLFLLKIVHLLKLDNIGWHKKLKENGAFDKSLDKPFL